MSKLKSLALGLRKIELEGTYLYIEENVVPQMYQFYIIIDNIKLNEVNNNHHIYFGEMHNALTDFINCWVEVMDDIVKKADNVGHLTTKEHVLDLFDRTINYQTNKQVDLDRFILPVNNIDEQRMYDIIQEKFETHIAKLRELRECFLTLKLNTLLERVHQLINLSITKNNDKFEYFHTFIALELAKRNKEIQISLEQILLRLENNMKNMREIYDTQLNSLVSQLYEKHKEQQILYRRSRKSIQRDLVEFSITRLRHEMKMGKQHQIMDNLIEEVIYWKRKLTEFNKICTGLKKLETERENVKALEKRNEKIPDPVVHKNIAEVLEKRKHYVGIKYKETAQAIVTYFAVPGYDNMFYEDLIGKYKIDEYGHKIYNFDHNLLGHVYSDGSCKKIDDNVQKYYFDSIGRYILDKDGISKIYQLAACTSTYKLDDDQILVKTKIESANLNEDDENLMLQRLKTKRITQDMIDPTECHANPVIVQPIEKKHKLTPEEVEYLWKSFGHILPHTLGALETTIGRSDYVIVQYNNPMRTLGHNILSYECLNSNDYLEAKQKEAHEYAENIKNTRINETIAKKIVPPPLLSDGDDDDVEFKLFTSYNDRIKKNLSISDHNLYKQVVPRSPMSVLSIT